MSFSNSKQFSRIVYPLVFASAIVVVAIGPANIAGEAYSYLSRFSQGPSDDYLIRTWVTGPDGVQQLKNQYYADSGQISDVSESAYYDAGPGTYRVQVSVENAGKTHWSEPFSITIN